MSLLGIRDISNLETPPPDRKAIETRILRLDDETIKRAIHRELNRDGQVYFVHNRVYDIQTIADRIQAIVPEARIAIAHGQMGGEALEKTMLAFIRREADILVATTIIESGLDIPNVNTIFINEADKYGLADLHQLRGRVGRYKHRAYAYLLLESDRPVTPNAVKRLKAIEEFTELGAGFKIALRDLEIRGAGNILGRRAVGPHRERRLRALLLAPGVGRPRPDAPARADAFDCSIELSWRAYLPRDYVPGPRVKVELYRRLGRLRSLERLADFRQELIDRFGPLPAHRREPLRRGRAAHPGRALAARADPRRGRVRRPDLPQRQADRDAGPAPPRPGPDRRREAGLRPAGRREASPRQRGRRRRSKPLLEAPDRCRHGSDDRSRRRISRGLSGPLRSTTPLWPPAGWDIVIPTEFTLFRTAPSPGASDA